MLASAGLAALAAGGATGCGDDTELPTGVVAKVGSAVIDKSEFQKRLSIAAAYQLGRPPPYPISDYTRCAAFKQGERPQSGKKRPSRASLVAQCKQEHEQARQQAMQSVILAEWLDQEVAATHVQASPKEIHKALGGVELNAFGSMKAYDRFVKRSKIPVSFFREQARGQVLTQKLMDRARSKVAPVTQQQVAAYFAKHQSEYGTPERRAMHTVITRSRADALAAKRELDQGHPWRVVVQKYSLNKGNGANSDGKVPAFTRSGSNNKLEDAVFGAKLGVVTGPVALQVTTQSGFVVFEVDKVLPAKKGSLAKVAPDIKRRVVETKQQEALDRYTADFAARFQAKTVCADGFKITECRNGPKTTPQNADPLIGGGNAKQ